jgi:rhodanese-related sulfurtransferase
MKSKVNFRIIFTIILLSSLIGLIFNSFYSKGIPLIRKSKEIIWAKDSLLRIANSDSVSAIHNKIINSMKVEKEKGDRRTETGELRPENGKRRPENGDRKQKIENYKNGNNVSNAVYSRGKPSYITLKQAYDLYTSGKTLFIDARDKWEFADGHITGAINIPEYNFDKNNPILKTIPKNKTIVSYCDGDDCEMSVKLADNLFNLGYKNVYIFFSGWKEWKKAGYAVSNE